MDKNELKLKIKENFESLGINIEENQIKNYYEYMKLLIEWNEKINLTAITEPDDIIVKHFVDSVTINKYIPENSKVLDIGTGAGFPGIPEKIIREDINIVLADSLNKRINFLNEVINNLGLKKIDAVHSRAEEMAHNKEFREKFDIVTSRAVASLNVLLEYMLPFVKVGGKCICMKGSNINEEIENSKKALLELGGEIVNIDNFCLPNTDIVRNIVVIKKIKETKNKYPRRAGTPSKDPII